MTLPGSHPLRRTVSKQPSCAQVIQIETRQHTLPGNLSLALQIALVAYNDHGEVVLVLDSQDLLLEGCDLLKTLAGRDGVNEQEPFACPHVLLSHRRVLFLTGGVEHIEQRDLVVNDTLLSVRVCDKGSIDAASRDGVGVRHTFDCWVVFIDEMTLDQLNRKTRFTDTTSADNHQFVLSQKLLATIVSRLWRDAAGRIWEQITAGTGAGKGWCLEDWSVPWKPL